MRARPVLTPDNYPQAVAPLLESAQHSVWIEQQYIKARQPATGALLKILRRRLDEVPDFQVRIILGRVFDRGDLADLQALERDFGLRMGEHVRLINLGHFVHCHNKLLIVDGAQVLLGSQNWSDYALTRNREASLLMESAELAAYFGQIFEDDWEHGTTEPPTFEPAALLEASSVGSGAVVPLDPADFVQV
jgi:phosphatidylserine/phosphatidylglycerophosphate/cardiolipin synthase-like enzyme